MSAYGHRRPHADAVSLPSRDNPPRSSPSQSGTERDLPHCMLQPTRPTERIPPSEFRPPHCPWTQCPDHRIDRSRRYRSVRNGSYRRKCDRRRIQRFLCKRCERGFSQQTFAVSYYMKRPDLLLPTAAWMTSGAALRRVARGLHHVRPGRPCHPSTIVRASRRIGSQCSLALEDFRRALAGVTEPVVFDHFETFVGVQENAVGIATPVGARSGYTYGLEPAWHRRTTARSRRQPAVAESPGAYRRSVRRMLRALTENASTGATLELVTDDHGEYARAIAAHDGPVRIRHTVYPNPTNRKRGIARDSAARARDGAMFPVDTLHKWFRHVDADHRRESIAFCRRGEALMERLAAVVMARNLIQGVSERRNDTRTPAMLVGLTDRPWSWSEVLSRRRWPGRIGVGATTSEVIRRSMRDPRGIAWPEHVRRRSL